MKKVMSLAERFAENDLPILLFGESGKMSWLISFTSKVNEKVH
ncbi:hypothetical protein [Peribacillus butanolivorans]